MAKKRLRMGLLFIDQDLDSEEPFAKRLRSSSVVVNGFLLLPNCYVREHPQICSVLTENGFVVINSDQTQQFYKFARNAARLTLIKLYLDESTSASHNPLSLYSCPTLRETMILLIKKNSFATFMNEGVVRKSEICSELDGVSMKILGTLLSLQLDVSYRDFTSSGAGLFVLAVEERSMHLVDFLLKRDASLVNVQRFDGVSPLMISAELGLHSAVSLLIEKGADVGVGALHVAARAAYFEIVQLLLENGASPLGEAGEFRSPLLEGIVGGSLKVVEILLRYLSADSLRIEKGAGAKLESLKKTALCMAAQRSNFEIVQLLLENGASPHGKADEFGSALLEGIAGGSLKVVEILLRHLSADSLHIEKGAGAKLESLKKTALCMAARKSLFEIVQLLLENGASPHGEADEFGSALLEGIAGGSMKVVEILLRHLSADSLLVEKGADAKFESLKKTALRMAVRKSLFEIVQLLLENGASPHGEADENNTPLFEGITSCSFQIVEILIKWGVNVNESNYLGKSALHVASSRSTAKIVEYLLKHGADVNFKGEAGETPIFDAVRRSHKEIILILLDFGADFSLKNERGHTIFHLVAGRVAGLRNNRKNLLIFQLLLENCFLNTERLKQTLFIEDGHDNRCSLFTYWRGFEESDLNALARHIIQLEIMRSSAALLSSACIFTKINFEKYKRDCQDEVAKLKAMNVGNSDVTFLDVLTKNVWQVARYLRNERLTEYFCTIDIKREFPIYSGLIDCQYRKGCFRKELLNRGVVCLDQLSASNISLLPSIIKEEILEYLGNRDIVVLENILSN